ncbi:MAG: cytochrome c biogenesis protein ResB [Christensenellaceae bacterium]|nr:cytochrome c biogenesis protein ResB [Christensenellaceae bacterium]
MKFGIILLIVIGIFSIVGTLIPQNKPDAYYASNYQGFFYEMIKTFELSKVYYSFWYIGLMVLLIINLFFCSIRRFIPIMKRVTKKPDIKRILEEYKEWTTLDIEENRIQDFAQDLGFRKLESQSLEGKKVYFKNKNPMGHLGSWLTHISLIIIILAFAYGSYTGYEVYVYGVPGTVHNVEGTDYQVQIDDFEMQLDNDMAVSQYITSLTLLEKGLPVNSGQTMVNYPFRGKDIKIYQNATGWAVHANLYKDDKAYSEKILYNTEYFVEDNEKIVLQLVNFFPDLDMANPMAMKNLSPLPNNPVMLYALFYNKQRVDMGLARMGNAIEYKEYKFVVDKPEMYTLLQINHDPGIAFAAFGGLLQVLGLLLAFYLRPKELRIVVDDGKVYLWSQSYGNDNLYKEELTKIIKKWEDK